MHQSVGWF